MKDHLTKWGDTTYRTEDDGDLKKAAPVPDMNKCLICGEPLLTSTVGGIPVQVCRIHGTRGVPRA